MRLVLLSIVLVLPAAPQDGSEKQEEMAKIQSLLDGEQWKGAAKALKIYLRKRAETPEEKDEISKLLRRADGWAAFEKIEKEYRKKERPRRATGKVGRLLTKYADVPDLVERAELFQEALRSHYIFSLEDFETWKADKKDDGKKIGTTLETDPKFVKHGRHAGRWRSGRGGSNFTFTLKQGDWSDYDLFCLWVYNEKVEGKIPSQIRVQASSGGDHYFTYFFSIDWVGWKKIQVPMRGKKSLFAQHGKPDWGSILYFYMYHSDALSHPFDIVMDDIRLEKAVR